jgi:hypothetical protein
VTSDLALNCLKPRENLFAVRGPRRSTAIECMAHKYFKHPLVLRQQSTCEPMWPEVSGIVNIELRLLMITVADMVLTVIS